MTPEQHFWVLKQHHEVKDEMYFIQVACTFELDGNELIRLFEDAKKAGYEKRVAREIVLAAYHIVPYEEYLRCYVLSGDTRWRMLRSSEIASDVGSVSSVASGVVAESFATKDGAALDAVSSENGSP